MNTDNYFIVPSETTPGEIKRKIVWIRKLYPLVVGVGLALTSVVMEILIKPRVIRLHQEFEVTVPIYTRYSLLITLTTLLVYFVYILKKEENTGFSSEQVGDNRLKITPLYVDKTREEIFVLIILASYAIFMVVTMFTPIYTLVGSR